MYAWRGGGIERDTRKLAEMGLRTEYIALGMGSTFRDRVQTEALEILTPVPSQVSKTKRNQINEVTLTLGHGFRDKNNVDERSQTCVIETMWQRIGNSLPLRNKAD